jgi:IS5 family transposase
MPIVTEFLLTMIQTNLEMLESWFSHRLYTRVEKKATRHVLVRMQGKMDLSEIEQACQSYHHQEGAGAKATHTVGRLVRALLVKYVYDLSLRQTEEYLRHHLVAKWYVGYNVFEEVMDHSSLERFEQWVNREAHRAFFDGVLKQIDADFPGERGSVQIGDTFAMRADAALEGSVDLLRHTSRCVLREIEQGAPEQYPQVLRQVDASLLFGPVDEAPVYYLNEDQRQMRRLHTLQGVWQLRQWVQLWVSNWEAGLQTRIGLRIEDLEKIVQDEFEVTCDASGQPLAVRVLEKKEKGEYRLGSATDPEATCRHHGGNLTLGYNVSLAVTPRGVIREIQAATGSEPDQAGVAALIEAQLLHQGFCPTKFIYDQAAGAGRTRAEVAKVSAGRTQLVARIPPSSAKGRFGPEAFHFNAEGALVCPQGRITTCHFRAGRDADQYEFSAKVCAECPLWKDCREPKASLTGPRRVFISDYQNQIRQAQAYNQTPQFRQEMKQRPGVERVIFMLTHYDGARRARSRGRDRADFQTKMSATARNLRTWLNFWFRKEAAERSGTA